MKDVENGPELKMDVDAQSADVDIDDDDSQSVASEIQSDISE